MRNFEPPIRASRLERLGMDGKRSADPGIRTTPPMSPLAAISGVSQCLLAGRQFAFLGVRLGLLQMILAPKAESRNDRYLRTPVIQSGTKRLILTTRARRRRSPISARDFQRSLASQYASACPSSVTRR